MPISLHAAFLREHVGHATLLLPAAAAIVRDEAERILPPCQKQSCQGTGFASGMLWLAARQRSFAESSR